jgi:hypothetical protein
LVVRLDNAKDRDNLSGSSYDRSARIQQSIEEDVIEFRPSLNPSDPLNYEAPDVLIARRSQVG